MTDDYDVGYRKPPKHAQFAPGRSGNPRGRPRGARGLKTDLLAALSALHTIQVNGKPVRGNRQQLIMFTLATRAASGDLKAQALLLPLIVQALGLEDRSDTRERLSKQDETLLEELLATVNVAEASVSSADNAAGADIANVDAAAPDRTDDGHG